MNKLSRLTALLLALIMLLGSISLAEDGLPIGGASGLTSDDWAALVDAAEEKLFFTDEGDTGKEITPESPEQPEMPASYPYTDVDEVTLVQSETPADAYITASGAAKITHEEVGQWQIQVDGVWATLPGETGATLTVTGAMLRGQKTGLVRKGLGEKNAETGEYAAYTQTAAVHIIESVPAMYSIARDAENTGAVSGADDGIMTLELANQENMVIIEVAYRISGTDQPVADSYVGQIAKKSALNTTLALPRVTGYQATGITVVPAELAENIAVFNAPSGENPGSVDLHVTAAHSVQDIIIYVEYAPAEVNFTVRHMWQNAENDEYEQHEVETLTGLTGAAVGANRQKPYPGFSYIWYDPTTAIAADGSTVVEIRYNREYYLMTFDLGGGYGVEPIYARYGAPVSVDGTPSRAGYAFGGWSLDGINQEDLPSTIPAEHRKYTALWTAADTSFTVQYWLEDPNNTNADGTPMYWPWYSRVVEKVATEDIVRGQDYSVVDPADQDEAVYYTLAKYDDSVKVAGDGSTTLNVYYDRKSYTLRFYYARRTTAGWYQVATKTGDSSAAGGKVEDADWGESNATYPTEPLLKDIYTKQTDNLGSTSYTYCYFDLTAKYGQNIEKIWPNAPIENDIDGASHDIKFVSWGTEAGSGYNNANSNKNIKGPYSVFDKMLLKDATVTSPAVNHWLVAYWNYPTTHTYEIYYSLLNDETADRTYNKVGYKKVAEHLVGSTAKPSTQTPLAFEGVKNVGMDFDGFDVENQPTIIRFYYKRNRHAVTFNNQFGSEKRVEMDYGAPLAEVDMPEIDIPAGYDASHTFGGWYVNKECTVPADFSITMPDSPVEYYAKWVLNTYKVRFFLTEDRIEKGEVFHPSGEDNTASFDNVPHGSLIDKTFVENYLDDNAIHASKPNAPYDFAGWYYRDEKGQEVRFAVDSMPIKTDMNIYAKWTSDKPVAFVFRYVYIDADGNEIELAPPTEGLALPFTPVTMSAKIGAELTNVPEGEEPLRYIPEVNSHTLNIQVDETKNEFVFRYSMPESVTYTVQYLEAVSVKDANGRDVLVPMRDGNGNLIHMADEKTIQTTKAVVTENYVPVSGYMPQATQLRLIVSTNEDANVIQFLYLPNPDEEYINATHILIDHENQKIIAGTDQNILGTIGQMEGVQKREYTGYAFSYAEVEVTVLNGTQVTTSTVPAADTSGNMVKHPLPNGGMHLYLYYTPVTYPYIVYHLDDQDRSKQLKDPTEGAALYGSTLTTSNFVQNIADYRAVSMTPAEIKVNVDDAANPTKNVMYIYYELDVADITITKNIAVSTEKDAPQPTQEELATAFTFQVLLKHATKQQTEVYVTLPEQDKQSMSLQNGVLTFTLQSGQSAIIHDLWGGTEYEVREIENAKFKTSYDAYSKGVLSSLDVHTVVTNTFPKYVGELTVKKTGMKDDKESAIVKAVVGNDVYYLVLNKSNGYTATISGIKPNTAYTVSEVTDWTWQYNSTVGQATGTITETQATATVTINNTRETDKWLHDESHVENNFGTGKSIGVNE